MFRSALVRLTLWYLLVIMILSVLFSVVLYRASTDVFNRDLARLEAFEDSQYFLPQALANFTRLRISQLDESKRHIRVELVYINLGIAVLGGAASYFFAKRTLMPIEAAVEAQYRFTADASHELRTPLTAMKTELEVALRDKHLTLAESTKLHQSTLEEVTKLEALSAGLLKLAHREHSRVPFEPVALADIVAEAVAWGTKAARAKKITVSSSSEPVTLAGDRWSLVELITILLDNAIKYSPANTTITVSGKRVGKYAVVSVADQGMGIRASDLPHLWERFYRADPSRTKAGAPGYGLGLSIAKKIIDTHRGTVAVTSTPGSGSTFVVKLSLSQ